MKKISGLLIVMSLILFSGLSMEGAALAQSEVSQKEEGAGWQEYSRGLYFKNLAVKASSRDERNGLLKKAAEYFSASLESGISKGRVYYQLSECYYLMGDPANAEKFARKAISENSEYFPPYSRIYGLKIAAKKYDEAGAVIESYLQLKPRDTYSLYLMGVHYFKYLKKPDKSLSMFRKVIENSRKGDVPAYYLENSYYNTGYINFTKADYRKAAHAFKKAYELNPGNNNAVFMLAQSTMNYYDLESAEKYATAYLKAHPDNMKMLFVLARVYYLSDDPRALEYLARVRRSRSFEGLLSLALYRELTEEDADSEKILRAVMKYGHNLVSPYIAIARIDLRKDDRDKAYKSLISAGTASFRNGLFDTAEKMFYKALELRKDNSKNIYYYLARSQEESENYSLAISYYRKYHRLSKENSILVHIGYLYGMQKNYSRAYECFKKAEAVEPESPSPLFFRGLVQIWEGKYTSAVKNLKGAIKIKGDQESYYFYLAVAYENLKDKDRAIEALKLALKYNPRSARSANYLGYIYAEKNKNLDEALKLIKTALDLDPENGAYLDSLGWIYYRKGDYNSALSYLLSAEEKLGHSGSPDPVVYDHIGDTYMKLGNRKMAVVYWKKSVMLSKDAAVDLKIKKAESGEETE